MTKTCTQKRQRPKPEKERPARQHTSIHSLVSSVERESFQPKVGFEAHSIESFFVVQQLFQTNPLSYWCVQSLNEPPFSRKPNSSHDSLEKNTRFFGGLSTKLSNLSGLLWTLYYQLYQNPHSEYT